MKKLLKSLLGETNPLRLCYHNLRGWWAALLAGFPGRKLTVIGITGTDGKTTTVAMLAHILHVCGKKVGAASTAFFEVNGEREPNPTQKTSVDARAMQSFLQSVVKEGCQYAVLESSSHGLMQGRLNGIRFSVAAITNISPEHLDYHKTMDEYVKAKGILFKKLRGGGTKVLNADDRTYKSYIEIPSKKTIVYSPESQLKNITADAQSSRATVNLNEVSYDLLLSIPGTFNLSNALCALSCAVGLGVDPRLAVAALGTFRGAAGRMERIQKGQPFEVFVDFTVTPAAYQQTLLSARKFVAPGGRLMVLTGSCGDRMREKRPLVGALCGRLADITIVTNEDPYTEDPEKIIDDVYNGVQSDVAHFKSIAEFEKHSDHHTKFCVRESDRLTAIRFLLAQAKAGDVLLFCGKGADITMMTKTGQIPWNEKEILRSELQALGYLGQR